MGNFRFMSCVLALVWMNGIIGCGDDESGGGQMTALQPNGPVLLRDMGVPGMANPGTPDTPMPSGPTPMNPGTPNAGGNMVPDTAGMPMPVAGGMAPSAGSLSPAAGQMAPIGGNMSPMAGQMMPTAGQMAPVAGNMAPMGGQSPIAGQVAPMGGVAVPIAGQSMVGGMMMPQGGNPAPVQRAVNAMDRVVLNEVMANPSNVADNVGEWIELRNLTNTSLDLSACRIVRKRDAGRDDNVSPIQSPDGAGAVIIAPGGYLVAARSLDANVNGGFNATVSLANSILVNSAPVTLALECTDGNNEFQLDSMVLNNIEAGVSTRRSDDDPSTLCPGVGDFNGAGAGNDQGTPGAANGACP